MSVDVKTKFEMIRKYVRMAHETDYIMPIWLPFLPVLLGIVAIFLMIPAAIFGGMGPRRMGLGLGLAMGGIVGLVTIVSAVINLYVLYKWIARRNQHFKRTHSLYREIVEFIKSVSGEKVPSKMYSLEGTLREMEGDEVEKSPVIWIVLSLLLPIIIFYVYHFLNKDFHKHERRESSIAEDLNSILAELGAQTMFSKPRFDAVPDRSTVIYLVLTIVTLGIFGLYWVYTLTKDPNEHFVAHKMWEEDLLRSLETLVK